MVYIKRIELSRFKSFGGTSSIPFLPGFTVISGPNGSGKSNILDALLFCLGLSSSKGMRAERLPDLINHNHAQNARTQETSVSVTFALSDLDVNSEAVAYPNNSEQEKSAELKVTRKLKVSKGGSYASNFYLNDNPCTVGELHGRLNQLRIYPEGYNVVLQGDVTRIITMNPCQRREIIDELAGVAEFDRKIEQTKKILDAVREREEKCQIIREELVKNRDRLAQDSAKAEKYQKLKQKIQEKQQWEIVLNWRCKQQEKQNLQNAIASLEAEINQGRLELGEAGREIQEISQKLAQLNLQIKELGEEEQISLASQLASHRAKLQQQQQRQQELAQLQRQLEESIEQVETDVQNYQGQQQQIIWEKTELENHRLPNLLRQRDAAKSLLNSKKAAAQQIAAQSQQWVAQQTQLNHEIDRLQQQLNPKLTEQTLLRERDRQLQQTIEGQNRQLIAIDAELEEKHQHLLTLRAELETANTEIQTLAARLTGAEADISLSKQTLTRLHKEQRDKQRQIDKLEATKQAQQEAQGTHATQVILQSNLTGICGLVAQLGQVEPTYQLALEIAAGARLGFVVVENERIASAGIQLLKQQRAGRATFLPLNTIRPPRLLDQNSLNSPLGFIDLAANLISAESRYQKVFDYVFGSTLVFEDLETARPYLGRYRIVTLEGELLEASGAMTGGSISSRSSLHFGTISYGDSEEIKLLGDRLREIEDIISHLNGKIAEKEQLVKTLSEHLRQWRQQREKKQLWLEHSDRERRSLEQQKENITAANANNYEQLVTIKKQLAFFEEEIPILQAQLQQKKAEQEELEASHNNEEWQTIQRDISAQESSFDLQEAALRQAEKKFQELTGQDSRLQAQIIYLGSKLEGERKQREEIAIQQSNLTQTIGELQEKIHLDEDLFKQLTLKLETVKKTRDETEKNLKSWQDREQKIKWNLQTLGERQQERRDFLQNLIAEIEAIARELPDPLPEIPFLINHSDSDLGAEAIAFDSLKTQLEQIEKEIRNGQKRLAAMEPVNMLALTEYEHNQQRLQELSDKLAILTQERTELFSRIENFTTLRFRAFKEAFDAVNQNFQTIFAELSDGDGNLELEDEENPFNGGLNLIAHPKGKPVQRLSSMSGGEKSLTALSFIFSLQRYRPSPFYAFDEVDMFLDGANVEKLAKMIRTQSQQAQFMVVSLRRPMIEASQRTIGVTQARGAYTQVLGIKI